MTILSAPVRASDAHAGAERLITDFTAASADLGWYVINDNVMGGRSTGGFAVEEGTLRFAGRTNTNGGGFSSIRTKNLQLHLSDYDGIRVRVSGDGRRYTWRLTTDARWQGREVAYWADFEPGDGDWRDVVIPFSDFVPRFRGTPLDGPALDSGRITGMGLMIYDNEDGPFALRLDRVGAWTEVSGVSLSDFRWKNRLLVVSAPDGKDAYLTTQQDEIGASADAFAERDMLLVSLLDDGGAIGGKQVLGPGDVASIRRMLGISPGAFALRLVGKDGSVKLAREVSTPMQDICALIDTMPMRIRESGR